MTTVTLTDTWTAVTLTTNELWQAKSGAIEVHCFNSTVPGDTDGFTVYKGDSVRFESGQTVYHRAPRGQGGAGIEMARLEISA